MDTNLYYFSYSLFDINKACIAFRSVALFEISIRPRGPMPKKPSLPNCSRSGRRVNVFPGPPQRMRFLARPDVRHPQVEGRFVLLQKRLDDQLVCRFRATDQPQVQYNCEFHDVVPAWIEIGVSTFLARSFHTELYLVSRTKASYRYHRLRQGLRPGSRNPVRNAKSRANI